MDIVNALRYVVMVANIVYALAYMVVETDGLFDVFLRLRLAFGVVGMPVLDDNGNAVGMIYETTDGDKSAEFITCFWCVGFWISITFSVAAWLLGGITSIELAPVCLASLGLAGFMRGLSWQDQ